MIASKGWPDPRIAGLYCHTSPDGVHWTVGPRVLDICPDTANQAAWDRQRGKYVAYIRIWDPLRKVGRVETDDIMKPWPYRSLGADAYFIWGKENVAVPSREFSVAFGYDAEDPVPSDHYNPAAVEYPYASHAYFAFPSAYMHFPDPPIGKYGNDGVLDIQMAVSRDGLVYRRVERAPVYSTRTRRRARRALELHGRGYAAARRLLVPVLRRVCGHSRSAGGSPENAHRVFSPSVSGWTDLSRRMLPGKAANWSRRRSSSRASIWS